MRRIPTPAPFADAYPNLARWIAVQGWIELGRDGMSPSFIRVLDEGGMIWEGASAYTTVDEALQAAEAGLSDWIRQERIW